MFCSYYSFLTLEIVTDSYESAKKFSALFYIFNLFHFHQNLITVRKNSEQLRANSIRNKFKLLQIHLGIHNSCERFERNSLKLSIITYQLSLVGFLLLRKNKISTLVSIKGCFS